MCNYSAGDGVFCHFTHGKSGNWRTRSCLGDLFGMPKFWMYKDQTWRIDVSAADCTNCDED